MVSIVGCGMWKVVRGRVPRMRKKARAAANNGHKLRLCRDLLHPRGVQSKAGGVLANGPFYVKVEVFGSDLIYREG